MVALRAWAWACSVASTPRVRVSARGRWRLVAARHFDDRLLVVCDGAKALSAAVREVFGDKALIQRCTLHYADVEIMPMSVVDPLHGNGFVAKRSAQSGEMIDALLALSWRGEYCGQGIAVVISWGPSYFDLKKSRCGSACGGA